MLNLKNAVFVFIGVEAHKQINSTKELCKANGLKVIFKNRQNCEINVYCFF